MRVLGFDCSSTTIGYGLVEVDNNKIKLISSGYIKPLKTGTIIENIVDTRDKIKEIIEELQPDYIAIEEIIKFMKGKSTASTIIMLTTFNRMLCLLAYDYLHKPPELCSVLSIRHGLKLNKILPKKEDMPELVSKHLGITFPYEYKKKSNRSTKPGLKDENFDRADGIAVALFYALKLTGKLKKKK